MSAQQITFWRTEHAANTQRAIIGCGEPQCPAEPRYNDVMTLHWMQKYRARACTHWRPYGWRKPVLSAFVQGPQKYFPTHGSRPRYAGHVPGIVHMPGLRFSMASRFVQNVLEGDFDI